MAILMLAAMAIGGKGFRGVLVGRGVGSLFLFPEVKLKQMSFVHTISILAYCNIYTIR